MKVLLVLLVILLVSGVKIDVLLHLFWKTVLLSLSDAWTAVFTVAGTAAGTVAENCCCKCCGDCQ